MLAVLPLVAAFIVSALAVNLLIRLSPRLGLLDVPNSRSLHRTTIPSGGGVGLFLGIFVGWGSASVLGIQIPSVGPLIPSLLVVMLVSLVDDFRSVSPLPRLVVHVAASVTPLVEGYELSALRLPGLDCQLGAVSSAIFTILFTVWFINLFNFMDGMDGLAGGMAAFGFGGLAILGGNAGEVGYATIAGSVAVAAVGFLVFNLPPARVFMGDVGSASLGFLAGVLSLWANHEGYVPLWLGLLLFMPFFIDSTVTLVERLVNRERPWQAHRRHYYQRSVGAGLKQWTVLVIEYGLMLGCVITAIIIVDTSVAIQWSFLVLWALVFAGSMAAVNARESQMKRRNG